MLRKTTIRPEMESYSSCGSLYDLFLELVLKIFLVWDWKANKNEKSKYFEISSIGFKVL